MREAEPDPGGAARARQGRHAGRRGHRQRASSTCCATAACCKARQLVGVRGAGSHFDGLHYVRSVTHNIKRGEYKQSFKLARNGLDLDGAEGASV